jgi:signal transduction histidine kinase/CheY-like chemotaxis protein
MSLRILQMSVVQERDVVAARQRARQISAMFELSGQDQTRVATTVSELARNALIYAGEGKVEFVLEGDSSPQVLQITISDRGPGIPNLQEVLSGQYKSTTGMGLGVLSAHRLMDRCEITTSGAGTRIVLKKLLPRGAPLVDARQLGAMSASLAALSGDLMQTELQQQNQELLAMLAEQKARQEELLQLTRELEDTNRGVVALYAELDEKADHLRRADEMKSRFLSNMSHEFRTPLSSIRALSRILLDRTDGELSEEQEKQVQFILRGAEDLSELVNDLLDLAKIEAGKTEMRIAEFDVEAMFGTLRGMLKPLLVTNTVELRFEAAPGLPPMLSDEGKISQILRNFISNALKFTEAGAVVVSAVAEGECIRFAVSDTGLGIAPADQELIFEEFSQVENRLQQRIKGTGLGLPLCRKLALLLGGRLELDSTPGAGSVFSAVLPQQFRSAEPEYAQAGRGESGQAPEGIPVLVIEDHEPTRLMYEKFLRDSPFYAVPARGLREADVLLQTLQPGAIILDIMLNGVDSWHWLTAHKSGAGATTPVIIASEVDDRRKGLALGADAYFLKPLFREELLETLNGLVGTHHVEQP